ncbi:MAG: ARPP-1 family domain-containing protein [Methanomicrobiales archaeon]
MDEIIAEYINQIELGTIQEYKGMSVFPLYNSGHDFNYITLKEALEANLLTVTEIDKSGSVPELKVINKADVPVLLLDGEELAGAKQNRVLNTTILLEKKSETVIPVSCTEQGRWSYESPEFSESGNLAEYRLRRTKSSSVHESLKMRGEFRSNQSAVWNEIENVSRRANVNSHTRAMGDVYQSKIKDLDKYLKSFPPSDGQKGLLVMINGEVMGLDLLSSDKAYKLLHQKLLKSYALEALLAEDEVEEKLNGMDRARTFLDETFLSMDEKHESIGYGFDHRLEGPSLVGSSLTYNDQVIHTAFFNKDYAKDGEMSNYRKRRSYRL